MKKHKPLKESLDLLIFRVLWNSDTDSPTRYIRHIIMDAGPEEVSDIQDEIYIKINHD